MKRAIMMTWMWLAAGLCLLPCAVWAQDHGGKIIGQVEADARAGLENQNYTKLEKQRVSATRKRLEHRTMTLRPRCMTH